MSCSHHDEAGAFVLCALEDADAMAFATHLDSCGACRQEVARLQVVSDTLALAAPQFTPPPELRHRIMHVVETEAELLRASGPEADRAPRRAAAGRPRRRWRGAPALRPQVAVLASVVLAVGVAGGVLVGSRSSDAGPTTRTFHASAPRGTHATLSVTGSRAALHVRGLPSPPEGKVYQVWYQRPGQAVQPTHTLFNVRTGDGRATVEIEEPITGVSKVMVTAEPNGGSTFPTSPEPVITASPT